MKAQTSPWDIVSMPVVSLLLSRASRHSRRWLPKPSRQSGSHDPPPAYQIRANSLLPTLGLLALAATLATIFSYVGRHSSEGRIPELIGLCLLAGIPYVIGAYWVEKFTLGRPALAVIVGGAIVFRLLLLPAPPSLSEDVHRYQWEGRVQRAGLNPYTVFPAMPGLAGFQNPAHRLQTGATTPSVYPPLSEAAFARIKAVAGYKYLFTALDLASLLALLLALAAAGKPVHRVISYAWNPDVVVAFALCGHHDSLAILTLLAANALIISGRPALSIASLSLSALSKHFAAFLLPVFLKRIGLRYAAIFVALVAVGYLPYATAGRHLFRGLADYARGWEANDSLFRLIRAAGNSKAQAALVAGTALVALIVYTFRKGTEPLRASLLMTAGLTLLSPNAFPWYFTWSIPFLCFHPCRPWLLMSVTAILGYSPVVAYAAGQPYRDSPFILALEYVPVYVWLALDGWRALVRTQRGTP